MKKITLLLVLIISTLTLLFALNQKGDEPLVTWTYKADCLDGKEVKVIATGKIREGWHVYDVEKMEGLFAPAATGFILVDTVNLQKSGLTTSPSKIHKAYDKALEMESSYYEGEVILEQKFKLINKTDSVRFMIEYQACNDRQCMFPFPERTALPMPEKCK